jgi:hypothetical protein
MAWGLLPIGALGCAATFPAASLASSAPQIGFTSVEVGETSATLTAAIRPEGLETKYEFWLEGETTAAEVGEGQISASRLEQEVTAHVASLKPNHKYTYWVLASNKAGSRTSLPASFTTEAAPPGCPNGCGPGKPTESEAENWNLEGAERAAREASRLEAERQAKKREEEERPAKEAAARAAKERETREAVERESEAALSRSSKCVVPQLKGDSLSAARKALRTAHCTLGRVSKPSKHSHRLVVTSQTVRAGHELAQGAAVGVRLRPASRTARRRS